MRHRDKLVFVGQPLASPYGRGAPYGGGEGPLSHGCAVTAPPVGEPRPLRDKQQFVLLFFDAIHTYGTVSPDFT